MATASAALLAAHGSLKAIPAGNTRRLAELHQKIEATNEKDTGIRKAVMKSAIDALSSWAPSAAAAADKPQAQKIIENVIELCTNKLLVTDAATIEKTLTAFAASPKLATLKDKDFEDALKSKNDEEVKKLADKYKNKTLTGTLEDATYTLLATKVINGDDPAKTYARVVEAVLGYSVMISKSGTSKDFVQTSTGTLQKDSINPIINTALISALADDLRIVATESIKNVYGHILNGKGLTAAEIDVLGDLVVQPECYEDISNVVGMFARGVIPVKEIQDAIAIADVNGRKNAFSDLRVIYKPIVDEFVKLEKLINKKTPMEHDTILALSNAIVDAKEANAKSGTSNDGREKSVKDLVAFFESLGKSPTPNQQVKIRNAIKKSSKDVEELMDEFRRIPGWKTAKFNDDQAEKLAGVGNPNLFTNPAEATKAIAKVQAKLGSLPLTAPALVHYHDFIIDVLNLHDHAPLLAFCDKGIDEAEALVAHSVPLAHDTAFLLVGYSLIDEKEADALEEYYHELNEPARETAINAALVVLKPDPTNAAAKAAVVKLTDEMKHALWEKEFAKHGFNPAEAKALADVAPKRADGRDPEIALINGKFDGGQPLHGQNTLWKNAFEAALTAGTAVALQGLIKTMDEAATYNTAALAVTPEIAMKLAQFTDAGQKAELLKLIPQLVTAGKNKNPQILTALNGVAADADAVKKLNASLRKELEGADITSLGFTNAVVDLIYPAFPAASLRDDLAKNGHINKVHDMFVGGATPGALHGQAATYEPDYLVALGGTDKDLAEFLTVLDNADKYTKAPLYLTHPTALALAKHTDPAEKAALVGLAPEFVVGGVNNKDAQIRVALTGGPGAVPALIDALNKELRQTEWNALGFTDPEFAAHDPAVAGTTTEVAQIQNLFKPGADLADLAYVAAIEPSMAAAFAVSTAAGTPDALQVYLDKLSRVNGHKKDGFGPDISIAFSDIKDAKEVAKIAAQLKALNAADATNAATRNAHVVAEINAGRVPALKTHLKNEKHTIIREPAQKAKVNTVTTDAKVLKELEDMIASRMLTNDLVDAMGKDVQPADIAKKGGELRSAGTTGKAGRSEMMTFLADARKPKGPQAYTKAQILRRIRTGQYGAP